MSVDDWPEWLPSDWSILIRKINERKVKCYIDPNRQRFYTRPQVERHLKTQNSDDPTSDQSQDPDVSESDEDPESPQQEQSTRLRRRGSSGKTYKEPEDADPFVPKPRGRKEVVSSWLPEGWKYILKDKGHGQKYKIFISPDGKKLNSRPQVMAYIASKKYMASKEGEKASNESEESLLSEPIKAKKVETSKVAESAPKPPDYEVISSTKADGLPPGWIKEVRMDLQLKKKDPYYVDPLSGYVFYSKLDALKYLDTGDIKICTKKPLRKDTSQEDEQIVEMNEGEESSPPEQSKEPETLKSITNGNVIESQTDESGTEKIQRKRKDRSITGEESNPKKKDRSITEDRSNRKSAWQLKDEAWLPDGWVVEFKKRVSGIKTKVFREVATKKKLYSKPQVLAYLGLDDDYTNTTTSNIKMTKVTEMDYV